MASRVLLFWASPAGPPSAGAGEPSGACSSAAGPWGWALGVSVGSPVVLSAGSVAVRLCYRGWLCGGLPASVGVASRLVMWGSFSVLPPAGLCGRRVPGCLSPRASGLVLSPVLFR